MKRSEKKLKIMLVEDESEIREILSELLADEGHECVTAVDGLDATVKLQQDSFDLLISDFRMPRMNGAELLKWCRNHDIHMPVIFITANHELFPDEKVALTDCCAALLKKPFDFNHLVLAIEQGKNRNHYQMCQS